MVAIGLSASSVARIRIAVSCLWEVVASIRVHRDPGRYAPHRRWVDRTRRPLLDAGLIGSRGGLLWQLIPAAPGYLPDFLTPPPEGLNPDLDTELAMLRATPPQRMRADLGLYTGARSADVVDLASDPQAGLDRLAGEIATYWRIALAPDWPRIRTLLEAEVSARARRLAQDGSAALLNDLHHEVRWEGETLSISHRHCSAADIPDGGGLVLIPSVFAWPSVLTVSSADTPQLAYPARGAATVWEPAPQASAALSAVLGRGRAQLLVAMRSAASTTELARRTGMSAGGVSQHLAALRAAGLVATHRQGRAVLNTRTSVAEALLSGAGADATP